MSGYTFSEADTYASLKERYSEEKRIQEHIQNSISNFIRRAEDGEVEFDGKTFNIATTMTLNESYAAKNDGERLPDPEIFHEVFAKYSPKLHYATLEATHFANTRGHSGGRVGGKLIDDLFKSTLLAMNSGIDFDLYGNGRGYRATIESATPAASSFVAVKGARLRGNMKLDWYDSTYSTLRGTIRISKRSVDRLTKTVYIDATYGTGQVPSGATAGDVLVVHGALNAGEPTDGRHLAGLMRVTDNSISYGLLSPSTWAQWQTVNQNASGGNLTQDLLQTQFDDGYEISGMYYNKMVIPTCQKRAYLANFLSQRRFNSNVFDTGATELSFSPLKMGEDEKNKKPGEFRILEDKNADNDIVYLWCDDCLMLAADLYSEPTIADEDGSELRKRIGYDSEEGFYRYWANTVTPQRNGIGKIYGLAVPSSAI